MTDLTHKYKRTQHLQQTGFQRGETYLCFLLIEVVNNDPYEEVQGEEGAKDDEDDKVKVHVEINFIDWLGFHLHTHTHKSYEAVSTRWNYKCSVNIKKCKSEAIIKHK